MQDSITDSIVYPEVHCGPFEGVEKRLIVQFKSNYLRESLRTIAAEQWQVMLDQAACQILSSTVSDDCTAYLLSESSLFVYDSRVVLKTCGTTTPLLSLPVLLNFAAALADDDGASTTASSSFILPLFNDEELVIDPLEETKVSRTDSVLWMMLTHLNYCFPEKQRYPHRSFDEEVAYLASLFPGSLSHSILKTSQNKEFFVCGYVAPESTVPHSPSIHELMMLGVDVDCVPKFAGCGLGSHPTDGDAKQSPATALQRVMATTFARGCLDQFWFQPCGYSCNILWPSRRDEASLPSPLTEDDVADGLATVHISPEVDSSYASFEWTDRGALSNEILSRLALEAFTPDVVHVVQIGIGNNSGHDHSLADECPHAFPLYSNKEYKLIHSASVHFHWFSVTHMEYRLTVQCDDSSSFQEW